MKQVLLVSAITIFIAASGPAMAQSKDDSPEELASEGITKLMDALSAFIKSIPQYEAPIINENGDIIIRRKHAGEKEKKEPKLEETST